MSRDNKNQNPPKDAPSTPTTVVTKPNETPPVTADTTPPDTAALNARIAELEGEKEELKAAKERLEAERRNVLEQANAAALKAAAAQLNANDVGAAPHEVRAGDGKNARRYVVGDAGGYFQGQVLRKGDVVVLTGDQQPSRTWTLLEKKPGAKSLTTQTEPAAEERASNTAI
ncbi:MAG: hypothetical protein DI536_04230 [Archangium gephyra]|uniref:Uncharacterized protein n=1 Tax=Archangium gephyra TaxID=48 RepID=A0A2W5TU20_9BACT|nr:MAG: hypothetical protein DI536_04230 [Archangium gephyra]